MFAEKADVKPYIKDVENADSPTKFFKASPNSSEIP